MNLRAIFNLLKASVQAWVKDNAARLGAALSYYTIFALPPLFIIVIFIASLVLDEHAVRSGLLDQVGGLIGKNGTKAIGSALNATNPHTTGLVASIVAVVTLILTATGLFIELQSDLNTIWHVEQKPGQGIWGFIKLRLLSFAMVVGIGFLLLVSLVVSTALAALGQYFTNLAPGLKALWHVVNLLVSFGVITVLFAMILKVLPDVKVPWRDVWLGAGLTSILFTLGKTLLGLYLGKNSTVTAYGAAGSLVLILLWVYYSGQILFLGAEFTKVFATRYGVHPEPKPHARWIVPEPSPPVVAPAPTRGKLAPVRKPRDPKELLLTQIREEVETLRAIRQRIHAEATR
jgi:membrane protein